ncbi:LysR family transcriptional regulator [Enterococcus sp. 669A]|uniref:LysR family transcriptional regulator n=1 Tax=Candidatus Enterococcus moelleringii TaxID=2815325 RepID=A0ABS3LDZ0_9ENTE|nr:LysR family transcriptional regulator [Enterococcus sp. 669A]MBO1307320.1 LysR family transcriptional regulator [Enterococcus sp. 669A]
MYNKLLDTFVAVVETGSFAKAAEKLFITNTAVMKQMNNLEEQLEFAAFRRTSQGIFLTEAGELFYQEALTYMALSKEIIEKARKVAATNQYTIRVGTSFLNPCKAIMDLWSKISDTYPQFKIEIIPFDDNKQNILTVLDSLGTTFDIIAGSCDSKQWQERCQYYELEPLPFCCAVSREHRLAKKKSLTVSDLDGETIMMVKKGDSPANDAVRQLFIQSDSVISLENLPNFYDMSTFNRCSNTSNVLLSFPQWKDIHPNLVTIPLEIDPRSSFGILYPKNPSQDVVEFLKCLNI